MTEGNKPWRVFARLGSVSFAGLFAISFTSSLALKGLKSFTDYQRRKSALPCGICEGRGFMICKLCNGNSNIRWSPLYDPVAITLCVCPTCEGNRVQRCLNCLGKGYA